MSKDKSTFTRWRGGMLVLNKERPYAQRKGAMVEPICPKCGAGGKILVVNKEVQYYPMTSIGRDHYELGAPIDKYWHCTETEFMCDACNEVVRQADVEKASF